jgi:predicted ATPase/DNA-binding CsgD family transcriptional regulator
MSADVAITQGNLPAEPNTFIGRERDRSELAQLLTVARVITLCGIGGIGKTRLALRLASDVEPGFPDGAWLVALSDITHPGLVGPRIAGALGLRAEPGRPTEATLADALRTRNLLLILDSCEHLVTECAELCERLLALCPWLRVVATSREPLRVPGETVWRVPPLSLPRPDNGLLAPGEASGELARTEAVRLFTERAAAARPGFALNPGNVAAVTRVCRTLDGMPLAIELAAARVGALAVEQISDRLADRFHLLGAGTRTAPPRQRTLRATVDWSYELLTGSEQLLLRRLAVFSGWNLEAAERVCADDELPAEAVLDLLAALIDKSLVALAGEEAGDARYRLLDTIRQYAAERLEASGELPSLRRRHRDYLLDFAESTSVRGFRRGDATWPVRLALYRRAGMELGNFREALAWSLDEGEIGHGLRLCTALRTPWVGHGDVAEGTPWFDRFLDSIPPDIPGDIPRDKSRGVAGDAAREGGRDSRAGAGGVDPVVLGRALACRAELAFEQQDYETARRCARDGLAACRAAGDEFTVPVTLRVLAQSELRAGRLEVGRELIAEAIAAAEATGNDWEHGIGLATQAAMAARQGRLREAQRTYQAALDVLRDNNRWGVAHTLYGVGMLALARGDLEAAAAHFAEALVTFREMDARPWSARCLGGLGRIATERGDYGAAREQLTESLRLSRATGQRLAMARGLEAFALLAAGQQQLERAVRLAGAALELRAAIGHAAPAAGTRLDDLLEPARKTLGAPAATALLAEGRAMAPDGAVQYATEAPEPGAAAPGAAASGAAAPGAGASGAAASGAAAAQPGGAGAHPPGSARAGTGSGEVSAGISGDGWARRVADGPAGAPGEVAAEVTLGPAAGTAAAPSSLLTPREWEIARLIARGLSNRGIADELVISPATAARHVANILAKLGFTSRAQIAVWASAREPAGPR